MSERMCVGTTDIMVDFCTHLLPRNGKIKKDGKTK